MTQSSFTQEKLVLIILTLIPYEIITLALLYLEVFVKIIA